MENISKITKNTQLVSSIQMQCDMHSRGTLTACKFLKSYSQFLNGKAMDCWVERVILDMYAYTLQCANK